MEVGEYVRTKDNRIGKIIQEEYITPCNDKHRYIYLTDADNEMWYDEENIIKSSPNIIDLIEIGDYVNGLPVLHKENNELVCGLLLRYKEENIQNVVAKEQFESMEYKIGE